MEWLETLRETSIPLPSLTHGEIPGDISTEINFQGRSVGIVGLNSAWLQLCDGDYKERLHVDPRQLMAVTSGAPDEWCSNHDFNLLVTHHPQEWLHPSSLSSWRSEIYIPSRFDSHLFGHMHESNSTSISEGGAVRRRHMQGASLFGLEFIERKGLERIHGYSIYELENLGPSRKIKHWPRKSHRTNAGHFKLIQNPEFDCNDDGYAEEEYKPCSETTPSRTKAPEGSTILLKPELQKEALRPPTKNPA
ncbi:hypothetical protein LRS11_19705 [Pseudomonas sp. J452]|uniref:hypothetical protein n=1 Tax=Pseudomonas sp. J452 TaxID=2898441 RepID=UPI0021ADA9B3|nr:hypothetical protein [Pseudomonas sp. J452]UUY08009.1 hypothetical protein LRS11_19705 [Pseudomonas sp. J452]